jgi:signal transduction histidine kinase
MASDLPDLMLDPNRIAQVVTNLLSNAIKFSPAEPARDHGRELGRLRAGRCRDHGEGISAENLPKLFQKFTQIDSTSTRVPEAPGSGS